MCMMQGPNTDHFFLEPWPVIYNTHGVSLSLGNVCRVLERFTHGAFGTNTLRKEKTVMMENSHIRLVIPMGSLHRERERESESGSCKGRGREGGREGGGEGGRGEEGGGGGRGREGGGEVVHLMMKKAPKRKSMESQSSISYPSLCTHTHTHTHTRTHTHTVHWKGLGGSLTPY